MAFTSGLRWFRRTEQNFVNPTQHPSTAPWKEGFARSGEDWTHVPMNSLQNQADVLLQCFALGGIVLPRSPPYPVSTLQKDLLKHFCYCLQILYWEQWPCGCSRGRQCFLHKWAKQNSNFLYKNKSKYMIHTDVSIQLFPSHLALKVTIYKLAFLGKSGSPKHCTD